MAFSSQFRDTLDQASCTIHYSLKFLQPSNDYAFGQGENVGMSTEIYIADADVTIDSVQITPQRWSVNFGGFTIVVNGDLRGKLLTTFRKGAIAELFMHRNGNKQRVNMGQLRSITGGRGVWRLEFGDFLTAMQSRLSSKTGETAFWYNAGQVATVTSNFNFSSDTRLYLDDIRPFEKETGQNGIIYVEDSQHSVTMFWTWSSKTITSGNAGYLTIAATNVYPSESDHQHLVSGDKVTSLARLRGRADYVFARLVMSTGNGTQGVFDDYPASWGLGVALNPNLFNLQTLNDYAYIFNTKTGTHEIDLRIFEPSNINTFLDAVLQIGMFPVWCENELQWRAAQNPNTAFWASVKTHITDKDIVNIDSHALFSSSQSTTYNKSTITVYNSTTHQNQNITYSGQSIVTLPASDTITRDLRLIYRVDNPIQPTKATADLDRIRRWDSEPYEELNLTVTEKHCTLTAGDIVEISSKYIYGLREASNQTYANRRAMVLGVRWNPSQSTVNLNLGIMS